MLYADDLAEESASGSEPEIEEVRISDGSDDEYGQKKESNQTAYSAQTAKQKVLPNQHSTEVAGCSKTLIKSEPIEEPEYEIEEILISDSDDECGPKGESTQEAYSEQTEDQKKTRRICGNLKQLGLTREQIGPFVGEFSLGDILLSDVVDNEDGNKETSTEKGMPKQKKKFATLGATGVSLGVDIDEEDSKESKPKWTPQFRPLITGPKIDLTVMFEQYINICRRFYGVKESTNFKHEYEAYCLRNRPCKSSNDLNFKKAGTAPKSEPKFGTNPYAKTYSGTRSKRRAFGDSSQTEVPKEVKKPRGKKAKETIPPPVVDDGDLFKYRQVRAAKKDALVEDDVKDRTRFVFPWEKDYKNDDEWQDITIAYCNSDMWRDDESILIGVPEKKDMGTNTGSPEEVDKVQARAQEILNRYSSSSVKRKRPFKHPEIVIPTRSYGKSKVFRLKRNNVMFAVPEVVDLEPQENGVEVNKETALKNQPTSSQFVDPTENPYSEFEEIYEKFSKLQTSNSGSASASEARAPELNTFFAAPKGIAGQSSKSPKKMKMTAPLTNPDPESDLENLSGSESEDDEEEMDVDKKDKEYQAGTSGSKSHKEIDAKLSKLQSSNSGATSEARAPEFNTLFAAPTEIAGQSSESNKMKMTSTSLTNPDPESCWENLSGPESEDDDEEEMDVDKKDKDCQAGTSDSKSDKKIYEKFSKLQSSNFGATSEAREPEFNTLFAAPTEIAGQSSEFNKMKLTSTSLTNPESKVVNLSRSESVVDDEEMDVDMHNNDSQAGTSDSKSHKEIDEKFSKLQSSDSGSASEACAPKFNRFIFVPTKIADQSSKSNNKMKMTSTSSTNPESEVVNLSGSESEVDDEEMDVDMENNDSQAGTSDSKSHKKKSDIQLERCGVQRKTVENTLLVRTGKIYTDEELDEMRPKAESDLPTHILIKGMTNSPTKITTQELLQQPNPDDPEDHPCPPMRILEYVVVKGPGSAEPVEIDEETTGQILEIHHQEFAGKLSYSKYKVQKYKFVTSNDLIQEFMRVTYPTMRMRILKAYKIQPGEFRPRKPTPKRHGFLIQDSAEQFDLVQPIICKKIKMTKRQYEEVIEQISPAAGKSYHDVQFEKSMLEGGPIQYFPSSFPASYCKKSNTLDYLRQCLETFDKKPQTELGKDTDKMIHTYPHLVVPNPDTFQQRSTPIVPGSRLRDKPMDMVFTVVIFSPPQSRGDIRTMTKRQRDTISMPVCSRVELLGSQSLGNIRDMFVCDADGFDTQETHHLPDKLVPVPTNRTTKVVAPAYVFLVGDQVLADIVCVEGMLLARRIKAWHAEKDPEREIVILDSGSTRIADMTIALGEPYVFIHQNNCQHIFEFKSGRVCVPNEADESFPRYIVKKKSLIMCRIDRKKSAKWNVMGFKDIHEPFMLLCTDCVRRYCFKKDGTKRGEFKLYQFNPAI